MVVVNLVYLGQIGSISKSADKRKREKGLLGKRIQMNSYVLSLKAERM